jgi:hypothetical protein
MVCLGVVKGMITLPQQTELVGQDGWVNPNLNEVIGLF